MNISGSSLCNSICKIEHKIDFSYLRHSKEIFLFFPWLQRFDRHIVKTPGRQAILHIDNCEVHVRWTMLKSSFSRKYEHPKTQPLDDGIEEALQKEA